MQEQLRALKFQVKQNLNVGLITDMATTTLFVRHSSWIIFRFAMNKNFKTAAPFKVHCKNYSGTMLNLIETILARRAEDAPAGRMTSKSDSRRRVGVLVGKTVVSDRLLWSADS